MGKTSFTFFFFLFFVCVCVIVVFCFCVCDCQFDLFALDRLLIPINLQDTHWCCAVVEVPERIVRILDSMSSQDNYGAHLGHILVRYICDEHQQRKVLYTVYV